MDSWQRHRTPRLKRSMLLATALAVGLLVAGPAFGRTIKRRVLDLEASARALEARVSALENKPGVPGPPGPQGPPGPTGALRAWAYVDSANGGTLPNLGAHAPASLTVTKPSATTGIYCVNPGFDTSAATALASVVNVFADESFGFAFAFIPSLFGGPRNCAGGVEVDTFDTSGSASDVVPFSVIIP